MDTTTSSDRAGRLLRDAGERLEQHGTYPAWVFNNPEVFALERERIFGRAWIYLGHASEIAGNGDFMVRYVGDDQFIVIRDNQGVIRAHQNACRHRGMQVCRAERGNATFFRCPYHGWNYSNDGRLLGVPTALDAYATHFDKSEWGLRQIPQLGVFQGLIFGCLDPKAPSLDDYLGGMKWYLQLLTDRTRGGLEVVGGPQRWIVEADWKLAADNFIGDSYHTMTTHRSMVELGLAPKDPKYAMYGEHVHAGNGHGLGLTGAPPGMEFPPYFGLPEDVWKQAQGRLSADQLMVMKKTNFVHGTVFPNLSFLQVWVSKDHLSPPVPMITFRLWHPIEAGKMEIWSWFLVDRDGDQSYKDASYLAYLRTFGISGGFEQDDAEIWSSITRAVKGNFSKGMMFNYQLSEGVLHRVKSWVGPGEAYPFDYAEFNQRAFHRRWLAYMNENV